MTRGQIIAITCDDDGNRHYFRTIEFNGDMYPYDGGIGEDILEAFYNHEILDLEDYENFVKKFDDENFKYGSDGEEIFGEVDVTDEGWSFWYYPTTNLYDLTTYQSISDYTYWCNLTEDDIEIKASNGIAVIPAMEYAAFNYRAFYPVVDGLKAHLLGPDEDSDDFEDDKKVFDLLERFKDDKLSKDEAQEMVEYSCIVEPNNWNVIYDGPEDFARNELDSIGVEDWVLQYFDFKRFAEDVINRDGEALILSSGRIAAR